MQRSLILLIGLFSILLQVAVAQEKLRIGVALPLTGIAADYGLAYKSGIELALADSPQVSGRIDFIYEDHQYDNKAALTAVRKLAVADKVHAISVWGWNPSEAVAPIGQELNLPLLLSSLNPIGRDRPLWLLSFSRDKETGGPSSWIGRLSPTF